VSKEREREREREKEEEDAEVEVDKKKGEKTCRGKKRKNGQHENRIRLTLAVETLHWASPPTSRSLVSSSGGLAVEIEAYRREEERERSERER
jgi:hypothetical protein